MEGNSKYTSVKDIHLKKNQTLEAKALQTIYYTALVLFLHWSPTNSTELKLYGFKSSPTIE